MLLGKIEETKRYRSKNLAKNRLYYKCYRIECRKT